MRIDVDWLGEVLQRKLDPERLAEQLTIGGLEVDAVELPGAGGRGSSGGAILDLDITPNRGDCFSVLGVAREVAALSGSRLQTPAVEPVPPRTDEIFPVVLSDPHACPRFCGRVIRGIDPGRRSPAWLRSRLERSGLRALHPVVDVTNYVMLEFGQPLHGYELSALREKIIVRHADDGEQLTLLDGTSITLQADVLVIADSSGAIGLAGIMGGQGTAVTDATADVFLEAAFFSPSVIAGRPRRYGLHTDASLRFERGVDPVHQRRGIERATALLMDIAGGEPGPVVEEIAADGLPSREPVPLRLQRLNAVLGTSLGKESVESALVPLEMDVTATDEGWSVVPPPFRFDVSIEEDLLEEVGRIVGYGNIPVTAETSPRHLGGATEKQLPEERIADMLCARGYTEVITYGFIDGDLAEAVNPGGNPVRLSNPLSRDMGIMRDSLWPGLLTTAQQNISRQRSRVRIFEIGAEFSQDGDDVRERRVLAGLASGTLNPEHWGDPGNDVDFFDVKSDLEALLAMTGRNADAGFRPGEHPALARGKSAELTLGGHAAGWLGALHPGLQTRLGWKQSAILFSLQLDQATKAVVPVSREFPKFPSLRRDIAAVVDETVSAGQVVQCVHRAIGDALQRATVFDIYRGRGIDSGRKSIALGLILQNRSRTLTDEDADRIVASATRDLQRELGATIRE